jgi:WxcM-like, C-terminal
MQPHIIDIELHRDARGGLVALESRGNLPFPLQRVFFIFDVPRGERRGGHVIACQELIVALQGSCQAVTLQSGLRQVFPLASPTQALYVPVGVSVELQDFSPGALVAVAADRPYAPR